MAGVLQVERSASSAYPSTLQSVQPSGLKAAFTLSAACSRAAHGVRPSAFTGNATSAQMP